MTITFQVGTELTNNAWYSFQIEKTLVNLTILSNQYSQNEECKIWQLSEAY